MKNFDYFLNTSIKVLLAFIICIMLIIGLLFVTPVYVHAESSVSPLPINTYVRIDTYNGEPRFVNSPISDLFVFGAPLNGSSSNSLIWVYSSSGNYSVLRSSDGVNNNIGTYSLSFQDNYFNSEYSLYYEVLGSLFTSDYLPIFSSIDEGIAAVYDYINQSSGPSLYEGLNIPAGYLARIRVSNGSKFTMLTTMGTENVSFQDKWVYTSQWYKFNDSADPSVVMSSDGTTIPWSRYGNLNLLGQTNKAQYTISSTVGSYVWVYNPAYMVGQNADLYDTKLNSSIQLVDVQSIDQVRIFALSSTYGFNGVVSSTSTSSGITYDPDNQSWVNDQGDSVTPSDYGDTNVPATGSTIVQQLESFLSQLVERIERILVAPVDYINTLVSAASNFFNWLSGLWSWLPPAVTSALTAVLYIMACVGALKILWR